MSANSSSRNLRVNTYVSGQQEKPDIAVGALSNFVITWQSARQDGDGFGIFGRAYGGSTAPLASEFQVNSTTQGDQTDAAVAADANGNFVVTWASNQAVGRGLYAQQFRSTGERIGSEFRINVGTFQQQANPDVASDALGNFVVVYESRGGLNNNSLGQDTSGSGIFGQRFDRTGAITGPEFRVNTLTQGNQIAPAVAMNGLGEFVVTWASPSGNGSGIFGQRYSNAGLPLGIEFQVNSAAQGNQTAPAVAFDDNGNFVVAWQGQGGRDGDGYGIYAQRYGFNGSPSGDEILVNSTTRGDQTAPSVAIDSGGAFTVVWSGRSSSNRRTAIFGQRFTASGSRDDSEFVVNDSTTNDQINPVVALSPTADFLVAWQDQGRQGDANILARTTVFKRQIRGTQRDDDLKGDSQGDQILGLRGKDNLQGLGGNDVLKGGPGDDTLEGGNDNDVLQGGANADKLDGGNGDDTLTGGNGIDTFVLRSKRGNTLITDFEDGIDLLGLTPGINPTKVRVEQQGANTIVTWQGVRLATLLGIQARDISYPDDFVEAPVRGKKLTGTSRADTLVGTSGSDEILGLGGNDTLSGRAGDDTLDGANGDDRLFGEDGIDTLIGGNGNDTLTGGRGDDYLEADNGSDMLMGGAGSDTFFLQRKTGSTTIQDFEDGVDLLSLDPDSGLSLKSLSFEKQGNDTRIVGGGQVLALLKNVSPMEITTGPSDFI